MVSNEHQEKSIDNINKINEYLTGLSSFAGNAGLNHIFGENYKIKEFILKKKYEEALKSIDETLKYIKSLQWFPGNAALMWTAESLEKTKVLLSGKNEPAPMPKAETKPEAEPKPEYDDPTPAVDPESEPETAGDPQ